jgi:hypothetical protein
MSLPPASQQQLPYALLYGGIQPGPAEHLAGPLGSHETRVNSPLNHGALEFGESATDLKYELPVWRRRVDVLLIEIEVDAAHLQVLDRVEQVNQRTPMPSR